MTHSQSSCGACAFFDDHQSNTGTASQKADGLCRFNPPISQPAPEAHGLWPVVSEKDWCGHFAPESKAGMQAAE